MSESEVARLRREIEEHTEAARRGLYGFAMVARHEIISRRYKAIDACRQQLKRVVGEEEAETIAIEAYNKTMERVESLMHQKADFPQNPTWEPLRRLETRPPLPDLEPELRRILEAHGATIEATAETYIVQFPEGTKQNELWPRMRSHCLSQIAFPDGYVVYHTETIDGIRFLSVAAQDMPRKLREKYGYE